MKSISPAALAVVLALGASAGIISPAVSAQTKPAATAAAPVAAPRKLSKEASKAISALQKVVNAKDAAGYPAALAAAQAAAKNADDRYVIAQLRLNQAININDQPAQIAAIEEMVASGGTRPEDMKILYNGLAGLYYAVKSYDQAAAGLEKLIALDPNDTNTMLKLAELRAEQKRNGDAVALVERAITTAKANGQSPAENWYKRGLQFAYEGKLMPQSIKLARDVVTINPSSDNWRNAILIYRQGSDLDAETQLDLMRLMRSTKALTKESDIYSLASMLQRGNYPAEAQAVINESAAAGYIKSSSASFADILRLVTPKIAEDKAALAGLEARAKSDPTGRLAIKVADGYFGHQNYAKAEEFYRLGLQKGSIDANLANSRLGITLAMTGQKAEAETAFKAVTGTRQDIANFWLLWMSQPR